MQIYPNPVQDDGIVTISSNGEENIQAINLDNQANKMVGLSLLDDRQRVLQKFLPNTQENLTTIRLKAGLKGTYILRATFEDGSVETKRVLVEE